MLPIARAREAIEGIASLQAVETARVFALLNAVLAGMVALAAVLRMSAQDVPLTLAIVAGAAIGLGCSFLVRGRWSLAGASSSSWAVVISSAAGGLALWIVNFYVIAPLFGWTWFPNGTNPVVQFIAHTVFYGTVLGLILDRSLFAHRAPSIS